MIEEDYRHWIPAEKRAAPMSTLDDIIKWLRTSDDARKAPTGEIADKLEALRTPIDVSADAAELLRWMQMRGYMDLWFNKADAKVAQGVIEQLMKRQLESYATREREWLKKMEGLVSKWQKNEDNAYRQIVYETCADELSALLKEKNSVETSKGETK